MLKLWTDRTRQTIKGSTKKYSIQSMRCWFFFKFRIDKNERRRSASGDCSRTCSCLVASPTRSTLNSRPTWRNASWKSPNSNWNHCSNASRSAKRHTSPKAPQLTPTRACLNESRCYRVSLKSSAITRTIIEVVLCNVVLKRWLWILFGFTYLIKLYFLIFFSGKMLELGDILRGIPFKAR